MNYSIWDSSEHIPQKVSAHVMALLDRFRGRTCGICISEVSTASSNNKLAHEPDCEALQGGLPSPYLEGLSFSDSLLA